MITGLIRGSALILLIVRTIAAAAQAPPEACQRAEASKKEVMTHLERAARDITDLAAAEIVSRETWEKARARRLLEMRDMLGLLPWPARMPLNVRITGTLDRGTYLVEKIAFESMPRVYVTANLYVPKARQGRLPAIVYVCGHAQSPYGAKTAYQRHGISFAKNGYVAFILDPIQIAETFALHHGVQSQEMYEWYARGYTPAGPEVWNAMRAIDYLETRPEVDATRIGMTGRSGGAAMSWFTADVDPRVKAVAPVMGISTYAANLREDTQRGHCDCMFTINSHLHDMIHQGALIAPRPLLMAHGRLDRLFPVAGYTEFEEKVRGLYRSYGRDEAFRNVVVETGHADSDFLREEVLRWFDRYLLGAAGRKLDMSYEDAPPADIVVFGGSPPRDAQNYRLHEIFIRTPAFRNYRAIPEWEARRKELMDLLRRKVFAAFPADRGIPETRSLGRLANSGFEELEAATEAGIRVRVLIERPKEGGRVPAILYVASDGEDPASVARLLGAIRDRPAIRMAVYPRGVGQVAWDKSFWKDAFRNAMHTGRTVDSMRLWDVLRALDLLRAEPGVDAARITVAGNRTAGVLALYAALLDPSVEQVTLLRPPSSHVEGPYFLNVLRYMDLPEAAALLAPRRLNFYGRIPAAYNDTQKVYALYGKPECLHLTMTLGGPLFHRFGHDYASGL